MKQCVLAMCCAAALLGCKAPASGGIDNTPSATRNEPVPRERETRRERREERRDGGFGASSSNETGRNGGGSHRSRPDRNSQPGQFDFYLLNLSWSPEFCVMHPSSEECARHPGFVVHGLWPQNSDGTYPEHCSDAPGPTNPQAHTDLMPTASLVMHEWQTHGTCSGQTADQYFNTVGRAFHEVVIPPSYRRVAGETALPPDAIVRQFAEANPSFPADSFAVSCGNNHLTAIEICLSKDLQPEGCANVRSCHANLVRITPQ